LNARVTGLCVVTGARHLSHESEFPGVKVDHAAAAFHARADTYLAKIATIAKEAGVSWEVTQVTGDHVFEAIIATVETRGCDLIVMASHGRSGTKALLLGSETQKVLTHTKIPVLVYR
jgi:nucleotide-binding universal stress UspA family protein